MKTGVTKVGFFVDEDGEIETVRTMPLDGKINALVVHIFHFGQCHAMALALHDILGWPIVGLYSTERDTRGTTHYAVVGPNHAIGDVSGLRMAGYYHRRKVNPDILRRPKVRGFFDPAHVFAQHHAPRVATELNKQLERSMYNPDWWKK